MIWCLALLTSLSLAHASPHVSSNFETAGTSDDVWVRHFFTGFNSDKSDVFWPYAGERERGLAFGLGYDRFDGIGPVTVPGRHVFFSNRPSVSVSEKFSNNMQLTANVGVDYFYASTPSLSANYFVGSLDWSVLAPDRTLIHLSLWRSLLAEELALVSDFSDPLATNSARLRLSHTWLERWKVQGSESMRWISDQNRKHETDVELLYGISQFPVWAWFGVGVNQLSFARTSAAYWSPNQVTTFGPRFDLAVPFYSLWQVKFGGSLSGSQEGNLPVGWGDYLRLALAKGKRDGCTIEGYFVDSRTVRSQASWTSNSVGINFNLSF